MSNEQCRDNGEGKTTALLVEITYGYVSDDGGKSGGPVERHTYWYRKKGFSQDEIDYGNYWDIGDGSSLNLADAEGRIVFTDIGSMLDWEDTYWDGLEKQLESAMSLEPGQWVEVCNNENGSGRCVIRATAYAKPPALSASGTIRKSQLSSKAKSRIRVNGKTLYAAGTLENGCVWFPEFFRTAANAVTDALQSLGGNTANVEPFSEYEIISLVKGKTRITFRLNAKSREGIVEFLRNIGVVNPEDIAVEKTIGDASGVTCVFTAFNVSETVG